MAAITITSCSCTSFQPSTESFLVWKEDCSNHVSKLTFPIDDDLDDRKNLQKILLSFQDQPSEKNWYTVLTQILNQDNFDKTVYEAAARITSNILAELDRKTYF